MKLGYGVVAAALAVGALWVGAAPERPDAKDLAAVRAVYDRYVATIRYPDPGPLAKDDFAPEFFGWWSNGATVEGRDAQEKQCVEAITEVEGVFSQLTYRSEIRQCRVVGEAAWLVANLHIKGTLRESEVPFVRSTRITLILSKTDGVWRVVHEHSSRPDATQGD